MFERKLGITVDQSQVPNLLGGLCPLLEYAIADAQCPIAFGVDLDVDMLPAKIVYVYGVALASVTDITLSFVRYYLRT